MQPNLPSLLALFLAPLARGAAADDRLPIDRQALVTRHNVTLTGPAGKAVLQVGNGEFACGVDVTGLQGETGHTMAQWGWHSSPLPPGKSPADLELEPYDTYGRQVGYATRSEGQERIYHWLRENPHRLNLGRLRLLLDGQPVVPEALTDIRQTLDLWNGLIRSTYRLAGQPMTVETCCHPTRDLVAVRIESPLVAAGRLAVELAFPYGDPGKDGANWDRPAAHTTELVRHEPGRADVLRQLDADQYAVSLAWEDGGLSQAGPHELVVTPSPESRSFAVRCAFAPQQDAAVVPDFAAVRAAAAEHWPRFWTIGGAIDLSGSQDPRWHELERRIVLSQYLLAVNEAGSLPPQESGLFNNSGWYGKFHLEMHWWHGAHYALWDRWELLDRSLAWYRQSLPVAQKLAADQGYRGARWPKMIGPDGRDAPSGTGPLLIWQQPHPIFYALLDYRLHPTQATLEKWREVVFETADFLASFAVLDETTHQYALGPPIKTVPENTKPRETRNPAFELSYWRFGLRIALQWRESLGLPPEPDWQRVHDGLAPLPTADGAYLQQEGMTDTYTQWNWEHPSLIGMLGMLPGDGVDPTIMQTTVRKVMQEWKWDRCWGWDFPMMAMAAARNGEPELALDALLNPSRKNGFNELGLSTGGPFPYFPSNGGLLYAVALMAAGWDGAPSRPAPGFPDDGSWAVRWEGLHPAP